MIYFITGTLVGSPSDGYRPGGVNGPVYTCMCCTHSKQQSKETPSKENQFQTQAETSGNKIGTAWTCIGHCSVGQLEVVLIS